MVEIRRIADGTGIEFFDGIENVCTTVHVNETKPLEQVDNQQVPAPVDEVYALQTSQLRLERTPTIVLRDENGTVLETAKRRGKTAAAQPPHVIEICTPLKLYLETDAALDIVCQDSQTILDLSRPALVRIGVRVPHARPRGTVTTSGDVRDVLAAVSTFGAAMPTSSPQRSFPTVRGHPPLIAFEESLSIPDQFQPPDNSVTLEVPASYLYAALAAPLTYYLGATLEPARRPRLLVEGDVVRSFGQGPAFAREATDLLHQVLFLDCLTRTARGYDITLAERERVDDWLTVDWDALYDLSLADRLRAYVSMPTEDMSEVMPTWDHRAFVSPTRRAIRSLPFLAYDLTSIHPPGAEAEGRQAALTPDGGQLRDNEQASRAEVDFRPPDPTPGPRVIGERLPVGQHPAYPQVFFNRLDRPEDENITIRVVCNDTKMATELKGAEAIYTSRDGYPVSVHRHETVSTRELAELFGRQTDYFHYVGHIEDAGFVCPDGHLDARGVDDVDLEAFFLNACDSLHQAVALIDGGAVGGIATDNRVVNSGATRVGHTIAELLTHGIPLGIALELAKAEHLIGQKYTVVGDPKLDITQTDSGIPYTCEISERPDGRFDLTLRAHLTTSAGPGSLVSFHLDRDVPYYLAPLEQSFQVEGNELRRFLNREEFPVWIDGSLTWSGACANDLLE